jgi:hypothetical protein
MCNGHLAGCYKLVYEQGALPKRVVRSVLFRKVTTQWRWKELPALSHMSRLALP